MFVQTILRSHHLFSTTEHDSLGYTSVPLEKRWMYSVYMWNHLKIFIPPKKVSKAKQKVEDHFTALTPNKFVYHYEGFFSILDCKVNQTTAISEMQTVCLKTTTRNCRSYFTAPVPSL